MSKCDIYLDNYVNGYQAGQQIVGHVQCIFQTEKTIKGIVLQFKGAATTHWTEHESHYNSTTKRNESKSVHYRGDQSLLQHEIDIIPQRNEFVIPEGVHNYPFSYTLPSHLPSTFSATLGRITYTVKAIVRRPLLKINYEAESDIKIMTIINLNDNPTLRNPVTQRKTKNVCCFCWRSGPISFEWTMPYTGFIPGQHIPININIENLSNSSIEKVKCDIYESVTYTSQYPRHKTRTTGVTIAEVNLGGVGAHGERTYHDVFKVPGTINPTSFKGCSIIAATHRLQVQVYLPCFTKNIHQSVPIELGHMALDVANLSGENVLPSYNSLQFPTAPSTASAPVYDAAAAASAPPEVTKSSIGWQMPTPSAVGPDAPPPNYDDAVLLENPYRQWPAQKM